MISKSQASQLADDIVEAGRRDRTWRNRFTRPLPRWFRGAHLDGLSNHERHVRFAEMSRRAFGRPGWVLFSLSAIAGIIVAAFCLAKPPIAALVAWPAAIVMVTRHYALRREFGRDTRAFAARAANTLPSEPLPNERA